MKVKRYNTYTCTFGHMYLKFLYMITYLKCTMYTYTSLESISIPIINGDTRNHCKTSFLLIKKNKTNSKLHKYSETHHMCMCNASAYYRHIYIFHSNKECTLQLQLKLASPEKQASTCTPDSVYL